MILGITFEQLMWLVVSQLFTGAIVFLFTALNEGRRHRLTANFELKQQHYSDLFEVLFKVTKGLGLENTNVFTSPGTFDVSKIEEDLGSKDLLRIDALNNIWATDKVRTTVDAWAIHRQRFMLIASTVEAVKGLPVEPGEFGRKKQEAQAEIDAMDKQLEAIIQAIHDDLLISRSGIWKVLAR